MHPQHFTHFASVALEIVSNRSFDYGIPKELEDKVRPGICVEALFRGQLRKGVVVAVNSATTLAKVQPIASVCDDNEGISEDLLALSQWMVRYYCASLWDVLKVILPSTIRKGTDAKEQLFVTRVKTREEIQEYCIQIRNRSSAQAALLDAMLLAKKGLLLTELLEKSASSRSSLDSLVKKGFLKMDLVHINRSPLDSCEYFKTKAKRLSQEQQEALDKITATLGNNQFAVHLLYGITGSGKTEVYLQAITEALKQDKGTIMLVPEISLTAQTIERFQSRFEGHIAILHHRLSEGERRDEWHRIRSGEAQIVIGARSAVFSPVKNLGLIIVDEEHELSYKQSDNAPCYQARDVAVMRGKLLQGCVILGSATPSLESYYNAQLGKYQLSKLTARAASAELPRVTIVDMKDVYLKAQHRTHFSDLLLNGIKKRQESGEQTILFLNRRGYHTTLMCKACGEAVQCKHCDVALTFHLGDNCLSCHLCGYCVRPPPRICPTCRHHDPMKFQGAGTEQIQKALHAILPEIRTLRIDADTTKHKGSHQRLLREFGTGKADVLIGTQMIAKGLHFPSVTLVGVLNSDSALNIPDFRASETAFQLMTQVSGRSGRGGVAGDVIIQTCMPENSTILHAANQNYEAFFEEELASRKCFDYPPFQQMVKFGFSGTSNEKTLQAAEETRSLLAQGLPSFFLIQPVVAAAHLKVKDHYRYQFFIKSPTLAVLNSVLDQLKIRDKVPRSVRLFIDVNPGSTFF